MTEDDVRAACEVAGWAGDFELALTLALAHDIKYLNRFCLVCGRVIMFGLRWVMHYPDDGKHSIEFITCGYDTPITCVRRLSNWIDSRTTLRPATFTTKSFAVVKLD